MYFDVKAFNKGKRRFENLDNIDELNTFVWEWYNKGFTKFVIKSYDESGFRRRRFISYGDDFTMNKIGWDKKI